MSPVWSQKILLLSFLASVLGELLFYREKVLREVFFDILYGTVLKVICSGE